MIKYQLNCKKCKNTFNSWFSSSKEFEKLKQMRLINCNHCNSLKVEKSIMSPRIYSRINIKKGTPSKINEIKSKIKEFQKYIKNNLNTWEDFTYEARSIHYGKKIKESNLWKCIIR